MTSERSGRLYPEIPDEGIIDIHCHLIPGVDDGCPTLEDSIACIQRLIRNGFSGSICTPHAVFDDFPGNVPSRIAQKVEELSARLKEHGIEYALWAGAEVRLNPSTLGWFDQYGVATLGNSCCALIDTWDSNWPRAAEQVIDFLQEQQYQPILAHPERMLLPDANMEPLLDYLQSRGVWLQGNLNSLAGGEGRAARERMRKWLAEDRYFVIASDLHRPWDMDGRMEGIEILEREVGAAKRKMLLCDRPREILSSQQVRITS